MFRVLVIIFSLLAMAALAMDLYSSLSTDGKIRFAPLGEWWLWIHRESLLVLQPAVERHISPVLWDPGIQTVLEWPMVANLAGLAMIFWVLHFVTHRRRRRRPRIRR